jgi:hypothetical protein
MSVFSLSHLGLLYGVEVTVVLLVVFWVLLPFMFSDGNVDESYGSLLCLRGSSFLFWLGNGQRDVFFSMKEPFFLYRLFSVCVHFSLKAFLIEARCSIWLSLRFFRSSWIRFSVSIIPLELLSESLMSSSVFISLLSSRVFSVSVKVGLRVDLVVIVVVFWIEGDFSISIE